jgi:hypothetical protein
MEYLGPPPPSGQVQMMFSYGSLIPQVLQCRQFEGLSFNRLVPPAFSSNSYTLIELDKIYKLMYVLFLSLIGGGFSGDFELCFGFRCSLTCGKLK